MRIVYTSPIAISPPPAELSSGLIFTDTSFLDPTVFGLVVGRVMDEVGLLTDCKVRFWLFAVKPVPHSLE